MGSTLLIEPGEKLLFCLEQEKLNALQLLKGKMSLTNTKMNGCFGKKVAAFARIAKLLNAKTCVYLFNTTRLNIKPLICFF